MTQTVWAVIEEGIVKTGYSEMVARIMYVNGRWVIDNTSCDLQCITEPQLREIADFISRLEAEDQGV